MNNAVSAVGEEQRSRRRRIEEKSTFQFNTEDVKAPVEDFIPKLTVEESDIIGRAATVTRERLSQNRGLRKEALAKFADTMVSSFLTLPYVLAQ